MNVKEIKQNQTKKILQFSIPAIIAMVLTSLITVADGFFMGMYAGEAGIAAVNLGLPIVYLYLGVGLIFVFKLHNDVLFSANALAAWGKGAGD